MTDRHCDMVLGSDEECCNMSIAPEACILNHGMRITASHVSVGLSYFFPLSSTSSLMVAVVPVLHLMTKYVFFQQDVDQMLCFSSDILNVYFT